MRALLSNARLGKMAACLQVQCQPLQVRRERAGISRAHTRSVDACLQTQLAVCRALGVGAVGGELHDPRCCLDRVEQLNEAQRPGGVAAGREEAWP